MEGGRGRPDLESGDSRRSLVTIPPMPSTARRPSAQAPSPPPPPPRRPRSSARLRPCTQCLCCRRCAARPLSSSPKPPSCLQWPQRRAEVRRAVGGGSAAARARYEAAVPVRCGVSRAGPGQRGAAQVWRFASRTPSSTHALACAPGACMVRVQDPAGAKVPRPSHRRPGYPPHPFLPPHAGTLVRFKMLETRERHTGEAGAGLPPPAAAGSARPNTNGVRLACAAAAHGRGRWRPVRAAGSGAARPAGRALQS